MEKFSIWQHMLVKSHWAYIRHLCTNMNFKEPDKIDQNTPHQSPCYPLGRWVGLWAVCCSFRAFYFLLLLLSHACYCLVLSKNLGTLVLGLTSRLTSCMAFSLKPPQKLQNSITLPCTYILFHMVKKIRQQLGTAACLQKWILEEALQFHFMSRPQIKRLGQCTEVGVRFKFLSKVSAELEKRFKG